MGRPNILMIVADQMRYDCIGAARRYPVSTPNIDALARGGLRFAEAYTAIPTCCPARQALLSGVRPESFGAHWNYDITLPVTGLPAHTYTWTGALQKNGYATAYVGKWHVSDELGPRNFGFDSFTSRREYLAYRRETVGDLNLTNGWLGQVDDIPTRHSRTHWLARTATDAMRRLVDSGGPWHLRVDFPEPHLPCLPTREFADRYDPADVEPWDSMGETFHGKPYIQHQQLYNWGIEDFSWRDWAPVVARYYAIISQLDDAVGAILRELDRLGAADDTVVVFTADHGDMCGSHRMLDKHFIMYDDVVRVPLIVRWPRECASGSPCCAPVTSSLDIAPTVLELAGLDVPQHLQGRSLVPLLRGETPAYWPSAVVATYNGSQFGLYAQRMIRTQRWKYVWNLTDRDELYDMEEDPAELSNCIDDYRGSSTIVGLREALHDELSRCNDGLFRGDWLHRQLLAGAKL